MGGSLNGQNGVTRLFLGFRVDMSLAIVAGAKSLSGASEDDCPGTGIGIGILEGARDIVDQPPVHGVEAIGPVERDRPDAFGAKLAQHGVIGEIGHW